MRRPAAPILGLLVALMLLTPLVAAPRAAAQADSILMELLIAQARSQPSLAGPIADELTLDLETITFSLARVDLRDFYATAEFTNPYPATEHLWDIGFVFRRTGSDQEFRLIVDSDGAWFFKVGLEPSIATGRDVAINTGADETNTIEVVAIDDVGYFAVNGVFVATLDLTARPMTGDVGVGSGFFTEDVIAGERTPIAAFEVWALAQDDAGSPTPPAGDDAAELARLIAEATAGASAAGPFSGELTLAFDPITLDLAGADLRDFYAHAIFTNPYPAAEHLWDFGFVFRRTAPDQGFRLIVDSDGAWFFASGREVQTRGGGANLNLGAGESNEFELVASGETGYFAVNGVYVGTIDLTASLESGDVGVGAGFFIEDVIEGELTPYAEFEVWALEQVGVPPPVPTVEADGDAAELERLIAEAQANPSIAGPLSGELIQVVGSVSVSSVGVDVRDLYVRVEFTNPPGPAAPWDYGIEFRFASVAEHYRLIVDSTGTWYLALSSESPFASGSVPGLASEPGATNLIELVVVGDVGYFAVNGEYTATLDVSALTDSGDVLVATAFFAEDAVADAVTAFRDLEVWALDEPSVPPPPVPTTEPEPTVGPPPPPTVEPEPTVGPPPPPTVEPEPTLEPPPVPTEAPPVAPTAAPPGDEVAVRLEEQGGSGVGGLAVLTDAGETTVVAVLAIGAGGGELVVIHEGTCTELDPAPAYLLRDLDAAGRSDTTLNVGLSTLTATPHAIALHASLDDFANIVACGEV